MAEDKKKTKDTKKVEKKAPVEKKEKTAVKKEVVAEKKTEKPKEEPKKTEDKPKKSKDEKKEVREDLRTYVIPVAKLARGSRGHKLKTTLKVVRAYVKKHSKAEEVSIDPKVNEYLNQRGKSNIMRRIKVVVSKQGAVALVRLAE